MSEESLPLPISLVAHTVFCDRRAWLEAAGETVASFNIEAGQRGHAAVDRPGGAAPKSFAVDVQHTELGLVGKADVVSDSGPGRELIEYKSTPGKRQPRVSEANRVQLALQRICLEAMGRPVDRQSVYFPDHRTRIPVELSEEDLRRAREYVTRTRAIVEAETPPEPLVDDPRCAWCSHVAVCLPDERRRGPVKRVHASDPDAEVLHLLTPGSRASIRGGRVEVNCRGEGVGSVPVEKVAGVVVHGNVDVSSALLRELLWRGVTVVWCSGRGRVVGFARPGKSANGLARAMQHHSSASLDLGLARELLRPKVGNQATQLRRNSREAYAVEIAQLRRLDQAMAEAANVRELLALEGRAAAIYFGRFPAMMNEATLNGLGSEWSGRVGRGATDPINTGLNFIYGLLCAETVRALLACGLDPHIGIVHSARRNKPALALDLMEQFRPIIADSAMLMALNNGELTLQSFSGQRVGGRLNEHGRRVLTACFERRMRQTITHPVYSYRVTWRRAVEVQARMLLGAIESEDSPYVGIRTR